MDERSSTIFAELRYHGIQMAEALAQIVPRSIAESALALYCIAGHTCQHMPRFRLSANGGNTTMRWRVAIAGAHNTDALLNYCRPVRLQLRTQSHNPILWCAAAARGTRYCTSYCTRQLWRKLKGTDCIFVLLHVPVRHRSCSSFLIEIQAKLQNISNLGLITYCHELHKCLQ